LVDPMCGSGTLLVEGAFMAADIAPGLLREHFGFLGWKGFDPAEWTDLIREAQERRAQGLKTLPPILGFDLDNKAVLTARANARRAGLAGRVVLEQRGLAALTGLVRPAGQGGPAPAGIPGLLVANPPYGKRLGDALALVETYETLGQKLKEHFSGWEAAIFTGNPDLGAHLGLRAHRVNVLYNGPLECKLLLFHIGDVHGGDGHATGSHAGGDATLAEGAQMFANRLRKNLKHLRSWAARENIRCYRVYDADLPEYAVAVDLYGDRAHVQEYAPPGTVDPVRARRRLKEAVAAIPGVLGIPPSHVVVKTRRPQRGPEQYQKLGDEGRLVEVEESDLRFLVNLTDYLDTGLFLDHRITRGLIREMASGRRFLNLFAYTGSASVHAAAGGATATTTIDLSPTYLDWARRNMALNGFAGPEHSYARADCVEWLAAAAAKTSAGAAGGYGLIFLDAPTFSNSKSMSDSLDIQRDHAALIQSAVRLLSPGGVLLFSTNYRRFKLDPELSEQFAVADISTQTIPPDFARNPHIHRCYLIHGH
jgi:23S rRNA (guanine2445-N2)-methyltransferase / 23S rRNA (guanine2069-N7)-methyltransferase